MNNEPVSFDISIEGDLTKEKWIGTFKAKKILSFRDQLRRDAVRRDTLGPNSEDASPLARSQAEVFSELAVRLVDAPLWWKESGNGLNLVDENVVVDVYNKTMKIERDYLEEIKKKGEEAQSELTKK